MAEGTGIEPVSQDSKSWVLPITLSPLAEGTGFEPVRLLHLPG